MLLLLPPSETKRTGGTGEPLDLNHLRYPSLNSQRRVLVRELRSLARNPEAMMAALKLGRTQAGEVAHNRALTTAPTMAALDRYTGVLYDALDAQTLTLADRDWAAGNVLVHSALFGPIGALDPIPAYRLSTTSRLPGLALKQHWGPRIAAVLAGETGLVLDLRSAGYVSLGAAPSRTGSVLLRVVTETPDGQVRALNHFNKTAKGRFTRALIRSAPDLGSVDDLLGWASGAGFTVRTTGPAALELLDDAPLAAALS
ncbi:peroxide stress protein YaaA [Cryobacterium algoricola]|uniref:Peroxide stress protein YaaA n=1 Tax=Cryobacterium algoricola TaxID=1259183 RepID=A0ABY2I8E7_9MICO|nr:peroxide stress protein YaaA [Cryobacterium algoricola]TFB84091.1 peroxide stress protein YaaA [Cryobacterium algoricola]